MKNIHIVRMNLETALLIFFEMDIVLNILEEKRWFVLQSVFRTLCILDKA